MPATNEQLIQLVIRHSSVTLAKALQAFQVMVNDVGEFTAVSRRRRTVVQQPSSFE